MTDLNDKWVQHFTADATSKHRNGFTIYKITSYLFPRASPEAVTVVSVWKRFSDLQRLQRQMKQMHQDLHLRAPSTCPSFTKWGYFKRFDTKVIEDRKTSALALFEFIAAHPPLFTSTEFVKFFQSSYPDPSLDGQYIASSNIEAIRTSLLLPTEVAGPLEYQSSEEDSLSTIDSPSVSTMETASLDGSIIYKTNTSQSTSGKQSQNKTRKSQSNSHSDITTCPVENIAEVIIMQDPSTVMRNNPNLDSIGTQSSSSQMTSIKKITNKLNLPDLVSFDNKTAGVMETSQISMGSSLDSLGYLDSASAVFGDKPPSDDFHTTPDSIGNNGECASQSETDLTISSSQSVSSFFNGNTLPLSEKNQKRNKLSTRASASKVSSSMNYMHRGKSTADASKYCSDTVSSRGSITRCSSRLDTCSMDSIFGSSSELQESYVFEAGYLLSLGARNEAKGDFQKAFDCYKAGIEKMLIGVQGDTNDFRRQFVKDKTTKYLSYAEKIYIQHLNNPDSLMPEVSMGGASESCTREKEVVKECCVEDLRRPYEELSKFRVLGVIGGHVMLVLCSDTQQCYAMKVIQKTCNQIPDEDYFTKPSENKLPILPAEIPYMVKLVAFVETPNLLFLVLQYSSGGRLFDYIENYAKSVPNTPARQVNLDNVFIDLGGMNKTDKSAKTVPLESCQDIVERLEGHQQNTAPENVNKTYDKQSNGLNGFKDISTNIIKQDVMEKLDEIRNDVIVDSDINLSSINEMLSKESVNLKEEGAVILKQTKDLVKQLGQEFKSSKEFSRSKNDDITNVSHLNQRENKMEHPQNNNNVTKTSGKPIELSFDKLKCNNNDNLDLSVTDIVINSQRLLLNVDDALSGRFLQTDCDKSDIKDISDGVSGEIAEDLHTDRLGLMVSRVERAFDGIQEKLDQFLDDDCCQFKIVTNRSALPPKALCKWSAELLVAIDHLHQSGVICRDLNPNNLMLGDRGHLMLTYMVGRDCCESLIRLLSPDCRQQTPDCSCPNNNSFYNKSWTSWYVAPELRNFPLLMCDEATYDDRLGDFWSYGAVIYELITGVPLSLTHPSGFNSHTILNFPRDMPHDAESLLSQLLCYDPSERLGSGPSKIEEIKSHAYFKHIDWNIVEDDYIFDSKMIT